MRVALMPFRKCLFVVLTLFLMTDSRLSADQFKIREDDGNVKEVEAHIYGEGQGALALIFPNGKIQVVPAGAVIERKPTEGPEPMDEQAVELELRERFGEERFRAHRENPYVIGLILQAPLESRYESRVRGFLKKVGRFMRSVDRIFSQFGRAKRQKVHAPKYPLVVLIFESDEDFEKYAAEQTGNKGLSAGNIAGFYSGLTNALAIRLEECKDFVTPLHEAIHQQVYNRWVFKRLAPIPAWFNEGIATGFEGNGERIDIGPSKISTRFARQLATNGRSSWSTVVEDDSAFQSNVLAGSAYTHAWSMHWYFCNYYLNEYMNYVQLLSEREPLQILNAEDRAQQVESTFGASIAELQADFQKKFEVGIKKQRIAMREPRKVGLAYESQGLSEYAISAVNRADLGGVLQVEGKLKNLSPIRPMSFHVTVETNTGTYAEWFVPKLEMNKLTMLHRQTVRKLMQNGAGGPSNTFRVNVKAVPYNSHTAEKWKQGQLPVPVFGRLRN